MTAPELYVPLTEVVRLGALPASIRDVVAPVADRIAYLKGSMLGDAEEGWIHARLQLVDELVLDMPIVAGLAVVIGGGPIEVEVVRREGQFDAYLAFEQLRLRFPRAWFQPAVLGPDGRYVVDPDPTHFVEIGLPFGLRVNESFDIDPIWPGTEPGTLALPPAMIADSGIIIEASDLILRLSASAPVPPGTETLGDDWRGVYIGHASARFSGDGDARSDLVFALDNCRIGSDGFSGQASALFPAAELAEILGFEVAVEEVSLRFASNRLTDSRVQGLIALPFFDDPENPADPVQFTAQIGESGRFTAALAARERADNLVAADLGPVRLGVRKVLLEQPGESDEPFLLVSARLTLDPASPDALALDLEDLKVHADGRVDLPGGWFDVKDKLTYETSGFTIAITKIGIGLDAESGGRNWVGFSGSLRLMEDLPAGAAVEGLRFIWWRDETGAVQSRFALAGAALDFTVPDLFRFATHMGFFERGDPVPLGASGFDTAYLSGLVGEMRLQVLPFSMSVTGRFLVGHHHSDDPADPSDYYFWFAYLDVALPTGIVLGQTGLSLYGLAGLIAQNMVPSKAPEAEWYRDWYRRPEVGATALTKWRPQAGAFGVGLGATLGTAADDGYAFSARALLLASFPGPILILGGKANFLTDRAALADPDAEPLFRFLVVFDALERSLLFALEVTYIEAKLLDVSGIAEAYFDFDDPTAWHLYVGERPAEKRVRAEILALFQANAYLMLDNRSVAFGFFIGYRPAEKRFGPLRVALAAYIEAHALMSWSPQLYSGSVLLVGEASLAAFGVGLDLAVRARLEAAGPEPWLVAGEFEVKLNLPWPLPDPSATLRLRWEEQIPPPFEDPLAAVQFDRHAALRSSETFEVHSTRADAEAGEPVPMDGVLSVVFDRLVDNETDTLDAPTQPSTTVVGKDGVRYQFTYAITAARVEAVDGEALGLVGCWAPQELADEEKPQKAILQLNTLDMFRVDRLVDMTAWATWDTFHYGGYICPALTPSPTRCWSPGLELAGAFVSGEYVGDGFVVHIDGVGAAGWPEFGERGDTYKELAQWFTKLGWLALGEARIEMLFDHGIAWVEAVGGYRGPLRFEIYAGARRLIEETPTASGLEAFHFDSAGVIGDLPSPITRVVLEGPEVYLARVCFRDQTAAVAADFASKQRTFTRALKEQWEAPDPLFEPSTTYRLTVESRGRRSRLGSGAAAAEQPWSATRFFRTGGPPADLALYVKRSVPADGGTRLFRSYAVEIEFVADHVALMYEKAGAPLYMALTTAGGDPLRDRDGNPLLEPDGLPSHIPFHVVPGRSHALSESEQRLVDLSGCDGSPPVTSRTLLTLRLSPGVEYLLEPRTRYIGRVGTDAHPGVALYELSFTTSRFEDFRALVESRVDAFVHDLSALTDVAFDALPPINLTAAEAAEIPALQDRHGWHTERVEDLFAAPDREAEHADHERLRELLGIPPYQAPPGTEVLELRDDTSHYGFLVQFAEPIDWDRTRLTATLTRTADQGGAEVDYVESAFSLIRNRDGTAAFLAFPRATRTVTEDMWIHDWLDVGRVEPYRRIESPVTVRPHPPPPVGPGPRPEREPRLDRTLFSIVPAIIRLTRAWFGLVSDRLLGRRRVRRERVIELDDLQLRLALRLELRFTRDFSRHAAVADWIAFQEAHPELPILTRPGDPTADESAAVAVQFDHLGEGPA